MNLCLPKSVPLDAIWGILQPEKDAGSRGKSGLDSAAHNDIVVDAPHDLIENAVDLGDGRNVGDSQSLTRASVQDGEPSLDTGYLYELRAHGLVEGGSGLRPEKSSQRCPPAQNSRWKEKGFC
ncbi:MAG: hypothetical protein O3C21_07335 [Verrucomicrobia bacterium]|nr:hypothetical protein [Verrucomicrobiota bacterium]